MIPETESSRMGQSFTPGRSNRLPPRPVKWLLKGLLGFIILGACRADRVDVSALTPKDRELFGEAATTEGVEVTIHGRPWDWTVKYDFGLQGAAGNAKHTTNLYCKITINPALLQNCVVGGADQYFKIVTRHELGHCAGLEHSSDPESVRSPYTVCWPND